jgi:Protein of unknown function (DUF2865)
MPVFDCIRTSGARLAVLSVAFVVQMTVWPVETASAQGFFDLLFGSASRQPDPPVQAPASAPPTETRSSPAARSAIVTRRSVNYCVRLCDGRYFPIASNDATSAVQLCGALCPASETKIFSGSDAAHSIAADGSHYNNLQNAFLYRTKSVPNCTCNGKDKFGLAAVDPNTDPTLRVGDVVATANGQVTVTKSNRGALNSQFETLGPRSLSIPAN